MCSIYDIKLNSTTYDRLARKTYLAQSLLELFPIESRSSFTYAIENFVKPADFNRVKSIAFAECTPCLFGRDGGLRSFRLFVSHGVSLCRRRGGGGGGEKKQKARRITTKTSRTALSIAAPPPRFREPLDAGTDGSTSVTNRSAAVSSVSHLIHR
jgi:hypothetical protein